MTTTIRDALAERDQHAHHAPAGLHYDTPAGPLWSAAAIADGALPHDELLAWLTWQAAILAHTNAQHLAQLGADGPAWIRQQLLADRDAAGVMGRAVHRALDADILDAPRPPATPEQQPFVDAFDAFVADHDPAWEAAAMTVAHLDNGVGARWAGRADFFANLHSEMVIGDWTTARRLDVAALKLVGLALCDTAWPSDGHEVEPPDVDHGLIVHLRPDLYPDTGYRIVEVDIDSGVQTFEAAALAFHHHNEMPALFTPPTAGGA